MNKKERLVAAIEQGTVIDHIPAAKTYQEVAASINTVPSFSTVPNANAFIDYMQEFIKVSFTYQNWSKEILNSFEYPYTNGYIEGCNNRIKVLKRVSFGMPRFARFRRRIMHIMLN